MTRLPDVPRPATAAELEPHRKRWWIALAVPFAVAWLLRASLFGPAVLAPLDTLWSFEPWRSTVPEEVGPANPLLLDPALVVLPWLDRFAEELRAGELPLWNRDNYLGQPLHAAQTGALAFPLHGLYYLFPDLGTLAWIAFAKLVLAGLFTRAFLRARGLADPAATLGGLAFALSGFCVAWLSHPHTNVVLGLPLGAWCVERAARSPDRRALGCTALCVGLMALGGHLQTALHVGLFLAAYALFRLVPASGPRRLCGRGLVHLVLGAVLGLALGAFQLLPFVEYVDRSRAAELFERVEVTSRVSFPDAAALQLDPDHHGRPDRGDYTGPSGDNLNYAELIGGYVGRVALVLALLALLTRRRERTVWFLVGTAVLAAAVAWQVPPLYELARGIGPLRSTKLLRLTLLVAFALALLAAHGLSTLERAVPERARLPLGLAALLAVAVELLAFADGFQTAMPRALAAPATPLTDFLATRPRPMRALATDSTILIANANLLYDVPVVTGYDSIEDARTAELIGLLTTDERREWFVKEIRYFDRQLPLAALLGIDHVLTREALPAPFEALHRSPGGPSVYGQPGALPRAFLARRTERVDDPAERLERLGAPDFDPWTALVEGPPPDGFELGAAPAAGSARLVAASSKRLTIEVAADRPALLVVTEAYDPGWRATVDGRARDVVRVDHALRGVWIAPGDSRVEMVYAPRSVTLGLVLSVLALLAALTLCLAPTRRAS